MTLEQLLLSPPAASALVLGALLLLDKFLARYANHARPSRHETDPYACGQKGVKNYVSPDYTEFYPYAALFTLVHAVVLLVATAPGGAMLLPSALIAAAFAMLYLVFRKVG